MTTGRALSPEVAAVLAEPDPDAEEDSLTVDLTGDDALSLRAEIADEYDRYLVQAARELYRTNRKDWRRFCDEHPELAALQALAKQSTSRDARIAKNTEIPGSPDGYAPYKCWSRDADKHRWYRTHGKQPDGCEDTDGDHADRDVAYQSPVGETERHDGDWTTGSLLVLHTSTNGGYLVTQRIGHRVGILEVCRLCGTKLELPRDSDDGFLARSRGRQPEYCSNRCQREVEYARDRAERKANKQPTKRQLRELSKRKSDVDMIRVAGVGVLGIEPSEWNRLQPRSRPVLFVPKVKSPKRLYPYVDHRRERDHRVNEAPTRETYPLMLHTTTRSMRCRPVDPNRWSRPEPSHRDRADTIAQRWHQYGAGGRTKPMTWIWIEGWDSVTIRQKVPE